MVRLDDGRVDRFGQQLLANLLLVGRVVFGEKTSLPGMRFDNALILQLGIGFGDRISIHPNAFRKRPNPWQHIAGTHGSRCSRVLHLFYNLKIRTTSFGGEYHHDLKLLQPGESIRDCFGDLSDDDEAPSREFLGALQNLEALENTGPLEEQVVSPASDYTIAMELMAAAYESGITGNSVPVNFEDGQWQRPLLPY